MPIKERPRIIIDIAPVVPAVNKGASTRPKIAIATVTVDQVEYVLRKVGIQQHGDERAVDARIRPAEHGLPRRRAVVFFAGHPLLYGSRSTLMLSARQHLLPERYEKDAIVVRGRLAPAVAIGRQNQEFAARDLEHIT